MELDPAFDLAELAPVNTNHSFAGPVSRWLASENTERHKTPKETSNKNGASPPRRLSFDFLLAVCGERRCTTEALVFNSSLICTEG